MSAEPKNRTDKLLFVDGQGLKRLVEASLLWLRFHQPEINALNVFPVPDGDTGSNEEATETSMDQPQPEQPEHGAQRAETRRLSAAMRPVARIVE